MISSAIMLVSLTVYETRFVPSYSPKVESEFLDCPHFPFGAQGFSATILPSRQLWMGAQWKWAAFRATGAARRSARRSAFAKAEGRCFCDFISRRIHFPTNCARAASPSPVFQRRDRVNERPAQSANRKRVRLEVGEARLDAASSSSSSSSLLETVRKSRRTRTRFYPRASHLFLALLPLR